MFLYQRNQTEIKIQNSLMLTKLKADGVNNNSIRLVDSHFTHRFSRVNLEQEVSSWERLSKG